MLELGGIDFDAAKAMGGAQAWFDAKTAESEALKQAMEVLRQIAGMKRRTREQKLASACVIFLDAMTND